MKRIDGYRINTEKIAQIVAAEQNCRLIEKSCLNPRFSIDNAKQSCYNINVNGIAKIGFFGFVNDIPILILSVC